MVPHDPFAQRYTNLRLIGRGGFGAVYRATDTVMHSEVALKLLNADFAVDPELRRRFEQEATAARKLNAHPNITIVFDRGEFEGQPFIVMELVEGQPLSALVQAGALSDVERCALLEQLCAGLHYAHQREIVHRDVKPGNLIVREDHDGSAGRTLKILDFGIAKMAHVGHTATGGQWFSKNYVSPEQIAGDEVGPLSDMFSVGAVAYELFSGKKAFDVNSANVFNLVEEIKQKIGRDPHQPLLAVRPDIDPELSRIVDRALAKAPRDRYPDLAEMRRAVRAVRERLSIEEAARDTIVLRPLVQAAFRTAREALQAKNPSAAVAHLERVDLAAITPPERHFIEQALAEARKACSIQYAEPPQEKPGTGSEAKAYPRAVAPIDLVDMDRPARTPTSEIDVEATVKRARERFANGERTDALAALTIFDEPDKVAAHVDALRAADDAIRTAEYAVSRGDASARAAAIAKLAAFPDRELVAASLRALQDAAAATDAAEAAARSKVAEVAPEIATKSSDTSPVLGSPPRTFRAGPRAVVVLVAVIIASGIGLMVWNFSGWGNPSDAAPGAISETDARFASLLQTAWQQSSSGNITAAVAAARSAQQLKAGDPALASFLRELTTQVRQAADRARLQALADGAGASAPAEFQAAVKRLGEAESLASQAKLPDSIEAFDAARVAFQRASQTATGRKGQGAAPSR